MAEKTRQELNALLSLLFPDNNEELISAADARAMIAEIINSAYNKADDKLNNNISVPSWSNVIGYPLGFIVVYEDKFWKSLVTDNLNNTPAENANWTEVSKATASQNIDLSRYYFKEELQTAGQSIINKANIQPPIVEGGSSKTAGSGLSEDATNYELGGDVNRDTFIEPDSNNSYELHLGNKYTGLRYLLIAILSREIELRADTILLNQLRVFFDPDNSNAETIELSGVVRSLSAISYDPNDVDYSTLGDNHLVPLAKLNEAIQFIGNFVIPSLLTTETLTPPSNKTWDALTAKNYLLSRIVNDSSDISSERTWSSEVISTLLAEKQANLVSGTNIKTVNGQSLLESGDLVVDGGGTATTQVSTILIWNHRFNVNYIVGSYYAPVDGDIDVPNLTNVSENNVIYIFHESSTQPVFSGGKYVGLEGNVYYPNALNLIELKYKAGFVFVTMMRVDRINVPNPLTIAGAPTHNVGETITPDYVINLKSIQWQTSVDNITFSDISGAANETYTLVSGDADKYIRFRVVYQDDTGMFETDEFNSESKLINNVVELIAGGFSMVDNDANGRADGVIQSFDSSGNTLYTVLNDGANGFTNGYQRVFANTATVDNHFMTMRLDTSHNASNKLKANTSYHVKLKVRSSDTFRFTAGAGLVFQSISNLTGTGAFINGQHVNVNANTGNAEIIEFDILTNAGNESNPQVQFLNNVATPNYYEFQISIVEN